MELQEIRNRWNEVLDAVLELDRITWLAFFDARLADFDGRTLTLDFSDARKLSGGHEFSQTRTLQYQMLKRVITSTLGIDIEVVEL